MIDKKPTQARRSAEEEMEKCGLRENVLAGN